MKVAVVGGGITGMAVARGLESFSEVTLFEAQPRLGGHTDTHNLFIDGNSYAVDSGFMAFNKENYPQFSSWLEDLGVTTSPANLSFSVGIGAKDAPVEYGTADLGALVNSRRNLFNGRFLRMLLDIRRFYRDSRNLEAGRGNAGVESLSLGDYLARKSYSDGFVEDHLLPLCMALWSTTIERARELPLKHVLGFMANHKFLQLEGRPDWLVVKGGSNRYVAAFVSAYRGHLRLNAPVVKVERSSAAVRVITPSSDERFDQIVFACHANQALSLLDPTAAEGDILGAFDYERRSAVVHSDPELMPRQRRAWSSWNVVGNSRDQLQITCWLNSVQPLGSTQDFFVTLDPVQRPEVVWAERNYLQPVYNLAAQRAQPRRYEISGKNRSHFAGSYWGFGTHEDGFVSGMDVVADLGDVPNVAVSG